jgi:translation initiation factor IF-2
LQASDEAAIKRAVQYREEMADNHQSSIYIAQQEQKQREKAEREAAEAAAKAFAEEMGEEYEEKPDDGPKIIYQNFVIKADVAGSVEAVVASVQEQGNNEVQSKVLRSGAGQITEYDVDHAATSNSIIVNFNNSIQPNIRLRADQAGVRIIDHSVIYHLTDEVRSSLSDLLPVAVSHKNLGEADILQVFPINVKGRKYRNIAGCRIRNGSIKKTSLVKILRWGKVIYEGKSPVFSISEGVTNNY